VVSLSPRSVYLIMRCIALCSTLFILAGAAALGALCYLIHEPCVDFSVFTRRRTDRPSIVLDDEGVEWTRFQLDQREPVALAAIPDHLIKAFIATEDRNFYRHTGISWKGIARSMLHNIYYRRFAQGASTITQQLIRLLFFNNKKTLVRKVKEQLLALIAEQQFSKDQIMEAYLNNIYFGCGIYGVAAAAQRFWRKSLAELTIDEAALLAGIVKMPTRYCPLLNPDQAIRRRNVVLRCMHEAKYLDAAAYRDYSGRPLLVTTYDLTGSTAPHLREMIRLQLEEQCGRLMLYTGGLTIKTTINQALQTTALLQFKEHVGRLRREQQEPFDGALITIERTTGAIKALVGGYDFQESQWNRAVKARRQFGSIFKPLIYATMLERGVSLAECVVDEPLSIPDHERTWEPTNVTKRFDGPMTLARALVTSNNIIAIKTLLALGPSYVIEKARLAGITVDMQPIPSLALGCIDGTLIEAAGMFNVFANQGTYVAPHIITWIKENSGKKIWSYQPTTTSVFSWATASKIVNLLRNGVNRWSAHSGMQLNGYEATGKTGTTNDMRSCWFVGSTPTYTTAIYLGADDNRPLRGMYAVRSVFPLWVAYNNGITQPEERFSYDPTLHPLRINGITGHITSEEDSTGIEILARAHESIG